MIKSGVSISICRIDSHGSLKHSGSRMQSDGLQAPRNFRVGRRHAYGDILVSTIDIFWTVEAVAFLARERFPERGPIQSLGRKSRNPS